MPNSTTPKTRHCPKCSSDDIVKHGFIKGKQRYKCKSCQYHFTVFKMGKRLETSYIIKALQLHLEGLSYREIERFLGISHVCIGNWVNKYGNSLKPLLEQQSKHTLVPVESLKKLPEAVAEDEQHLKLLLKGEQNRYWVVMDDKEEPPY